jgi:hypothetical protein
MQVRQSEHYLTMDYDFRRVNIYHTEAGAYIVKCFEHGYHIPDLDSSMSLREYAMTMAECFVRGK